MASKHFLRAAVAGTTLAVVAGLSGGAFAVASTTARSVAGINVTGPDHERLTFTIAPGGSATFALPAANDPIRVDIATVSTNGGVQTPSEVFTALVNVDQDGAGMSWIGTNSDGTQSASSTIDGTDITNLVCGTDCLIASLDADSISARTVVLEANAATSIIDEKYVINIWH